MLKKPDTCKGCPFYDNGEGFVPDELVEGAKVLVLLQNPGREEEDEARPAIGKTGQFLNTSLFANANLERGRDVSVGNTIRCRWRNSATGRKSNDLPSGVSGKKLVMQAAAHCEQYTTVQPSVQLIVACGQHTADYYGRIPGSIDTWHGFMGKPYNEIPVYITKHPAHIFRDPKGMLPTLHDWGKIPHILDGTWPEPIPTRRIVYQLDEIYIQLLSMASESSILAIDTEYDTKGDTIWPGRLNLIGVAFRAKNGQVQGFQVPWPTSADVAYNLFKLMALVPVVFWNAQADKPVLEKVLGKEGLLVTCPVQYLKIHDAMLAHALLYTEQGHKLEQVEPFYSFHNKQKHLGNVSQLDYNWGDCLTLLYAWEDLQQDLEQDPQTKWLYENQSLPLIEMILEAKRRGIRLDHDYLDELAERFQSIMDEAQEIAQVYTGWRWFNLGSSHHLILYMTQHHYPYPPRKKKYVTDEDTISWYRQKTHDYNPDDESEGISTVMMERYMAEEGCDIVLTCRAMYQKAAALLNGYINPLKTNRGKWKERVHPDQFTHTQNTGRWSTINPPISNFKKVLKPMLLPDEGWCHISFDKSQVELRLIAAVTEDDLLLEAFRKGWDVHTMNMCTFFGFDYPKDLSDPYSDMEWQSKYNLKGKDDERRTFSKTFVFRLSYGGDPRRAGDIPGARKLGLDGPKLSRLAQNYLREHYYLQKYWSRMDDQILKTRTVRTPWGRKRYLNGPGSTGRFRAKICLEGCNHPYQGGVSDHFNDLALRIWRRGRTLPLEWVRGVHDYQCYTCPSSPEIVKQALAIIQEENDVPMNINGQLIHLPIDMNEVIYA